MLIEVCGIGAAGDGDASSGEYGRANGLEKFEKDLLHRGINTHNAGDTRARALIARARASDLFGFSLRHGSRSSDRSGNETELDGLVTVRGVAYEREKLGGIIREAVADLGRQSGEELRR